MNKQKKDVVMTPMTPSQGFVLSNYYIRHVIVCCLPCQGHTMICFFYSTKRGDILAVKK